MPFQEGDDVFMSNKETSLFIWRHVSTIAVALVLIAGLTLPALMRFPADEEHETSEPFVTIELDRTDAVLLQEELESAVPSQAVDDAVSPGAQDVVATRVESLIRALKSDEPSIRAQAAAQLAWLGANAKLAVGPLRDALNDSDDVVRAHVAIALWQIDGQGQLATAVLTDLLASPRPGTAEMVVYLLGAIGKDAVDAVPVLREAMRDADDQLRKQIVEAIAKIAPKEELTVPTDHSPLQAKNAATPPQDVYATEEAGVESHPHDVPTISTVLSDKTKPTLLLTPVSNTTSEPASGGATSSPNAAVDLADSPLGNLFRFAWRSGEPSRVDARQLRQGRDLAERLLRQSESAFDRGLMSLPNYADQLNSALRLKVQLAAERGSSRDRRDAIAEQVRMLQQAVGRLEEFNQPASKGWAADTAYAQQLAADAAVQLAREEGDEEAGLAARQKSAGLALRQFELRLADFRVGLATLPQMSRAAAKMTIDFTLPSPQAKEFEQAMVSNLTQYREALSDVSAQTDRLHQRGAGLGRIDRAEMAGYELARTTAILAQANGNSELAHAGMADAEVMAQQAFDAQLGFYEKGTASLFDLTSNWRSREISHQKSDLLGIAVSDQARQRQQDNLQELRRLADGLADRRGRNAADVTFVRALDFMAQSDARRRSARDKTENESPASSAPGREQPENAPQTSET